MWASEESPPAVNVGASMVSPDTPRAGMVPEGCVQGLTLEKYFGSFFYHLVESG